MLSILFIVMVNTLFAQFVHYTDESNKRNKPVQHEKPVPAPLKRDTATVYHTWPDLCPGVPASIPVLLNYVPKELVLKITEIFKGHLYSISSYNAGNNTVQYKLKVCENGAIKYEYADESGNIIKQ